MLSSTCSVLGMQRGAKVHIVLLFKVSSSFLLPIIVENFVLFFSKILFNAYGFLFYFWFVCFGEGVQRCDHIDVWCILNPFLFFNIIRM